MTDNDLQARFIRAATWHGPLDEADALLAAYPALAQESIHIAAILADVGSVKRFLAANPGQATRTAAPYDANPLTCLGLSKYLRLGKRSDDDFLQTATALLDAGADVNAGFWTTGAYPEYETPLYGAAGVAHHEALTKLFLERGADPNDGEAVYHSPEEYNNGAMKALVETGRLTPESLCLMLVRKHDWHDYDGVKYLLEKGSDPNGGRDENWNPLHHAIQRDNHLAIIKLLFEYGADPFMEKKGLTAVARAARRGRRDILAYIEEKFPPVVWSGADRLIAACAMNDTTLIRSVIAEQPSLQHEVVAMGRHLLGTFAGVGNRDGVKQLLDLGIRVDTPYEGDGYYGIPAGSLAIHIAAWRGHPSVVQLLLESGSPVDMEDANGHTPLQLAIRARVDSYWKERCTTDAIRLLLEAGAVLKNMDYSSGDPEIG